MTTASVLAKEKIVSLSELQKNPSAALDAPIVRIVKNGKEIGIFMTKEEFEDLLEENLPLRPEFEAELDELDKRSRKEKLYPIEDLFKKM